VGVAVRWESWAKIVLNLAEDAEFFFLNFEDFFFDVLVVTTKSFEHGCMMHRAGFTRKTIPLTAPQGFGAEFVQSRGSIISSGLGR
jgi:hypothetical protein